MDNISPKSSIQPTQIPQPASSASSKVEGSIWGALPAEIKASIVGFLDMQEDMQGLAKLANTSKSNSKLVFSSVKREIVLPTGGCGRKYQNLETYLNSLRRYACLKLLNLSNLWITHMAHRRINNTDFVAIIKVVSEEKSFQLEELDVSGTDVSLDKVKLPSTLRVLRVNDNLAVRSTFLAAALAGNTCLEELNLSRTRVPLDEVKLPPALRVLRLFGNEFLINRGLATALAGNTCLEELNLSYTEVSLNGVVLPPTLRVLGLRGNEFLTNTGLATALAGNTCLEELDLRETEVSLDGVVLPPTLRVLRVDENRAVRNTFLATALAGNTCLEELYLSETRISLAGVKLPPTLRVLNLCGNDRGSEAVIDEFLVAALEGHTCLEELDLSCTKVSLNGVVLPPALRVLSLFNSPAVTNKFLATALEGHTCLEKLDLSYLHVSLNGVVLPPTLRALVLNKNRAVTDTFLAAALGDNSNINYLECNNSKISESLVQEILSRCKKVEEGMAALKRCDCC